MMSINRVVHSLSLALGTALLGSACQQMEHAPVEIPRDLMGDGYGNKTNLGGYWWTFVDRSGRSEVVPYVGKRDPTDTVTFPAELTGPLRDGNGIEGGVYHVKGRVAPRPLTGDPTAIDRYWDAFYGAEGSKVPGFCGTAGCQAAMKPTAGIGFGFKSRNTPLGLDSVGSVGISFEAKLGRSHTNGKPVTLTIPLDLTDVPDPTLYDRFGSYYVNVSDPTQSQDTNAPLCRFPGSAIDDETPYGTKRLSCFADLTTDGHSAVELTTEMRTYCLAWHHFGPPPGYEAEYATLTPFGESTTEELMRHAVKFMFRAYQPSSDEGPEPVTFELYVDDVYLLDAQTWKMRCEQPGVIVPTVLQ